MHIRTRLFELEAHRGMVYVRLGTFDACYTSTAGVHVGPWTLR